MRQKRSWSVCIVLLVFCFALGAVSARADVYMKEKKHTGSFTVMGQNQPEKDEIVAYWLGENKTRTDHDNGKSTIFLSDKAMLISLDHNKKTYAEMSMEIDKEVDKALSDKGEEGKKVAGLMKGLTKGMMGGVSVKVTETGETKKIGSWNCRKYIIERKMPMGETRSEAWATEDLKINYGLYLTSANAMMASQPGFQEMIKEMQKVKGVIAFETDTAKMMGSEVTSTTELLECGDKTPPAGNYEVPAGYTKVKSMRGMN
jgi:anionic cell wall polymer biosynthesis LytR-Cps2A-Psr (LCP) family protein